MSSNNVSVAVRIRPKLQKEEIAMCNICTSVSPGEPQVWLGHDKAFTFDHVFDLNSAQDQIYDSCVRSLVEGCFEGFNATVLAYGQTGSGKTYTMGTGFDVSYPQEQLGIIPRAVEHLFGGIQLRRDDALSKGLPMPEFTITAQFIEIYNEELIDLLCEKSKKGAQIRIHEDFKRGIVLHGAFNKTVATADETLQCLKSGSLFRTTGATLMNAESSRSHAIFTLFIEQKRIDRVNVNGDDGCSENGMPQQELVTLTAKFNFVDLAGSERLSRTGAVGDRAREGISINSGLLHLGNVISALGDRSKKVSHIPYRDSKLTRVLQDSLGGNSVTTMIACISPCDRDFVETLNTLRYANRAKNIKNKVVANQDSQTQLINELRRQILQLQIENQDLRQGKLFVKNDGEVELNDVYHENKMLQRELNNANVRLKALNTRLEDVSNENISLKEKLVKNQISLSSEPNGAECDVDHAQSLISGYLKEINNLRSKVVESDGLLSYYRKQLNLRENDLNYDNNKQDLLERAKQELEFGKSCLSQMNMSMTSADTNGNRLGELNEDDNEDSSGDEDEEEDFEKKLADHNAELATLMENLASKERLIEEFEARERRIIELTEHYEQKISSFKTKIKQIEDERDTLMNKFKRDAKEDQSTKLKKEEFEKRVNVLQNEIRKYESLKREHQKVLNQEMSSKERLKKLREEIIAAKQQRVKLIAQMREQMSRHTKEIQKNRSVINKLTREDHKKYVKIRDLEVQSSQQKKMLQRRDQEIKALKKLVKPMSDRVAGRMPPQFKRVTHGNTPQKARKRWYTFEQKFNKLVLQRIQFEHEERKLERYFQERQEKIEILNTLKENKSGDVNNEYIENVQINIDYLSKCIEETQNAIMQLEDDHININQLFNNMDPDEVMYIMDKLANSAINYAILSSQRDDELKEKDAKLNTLLSENMYSNHLLNYMVSKNFEQDENGLYPAILPVDPIDSNDLMNGPTQQTTAPQATPLSDKFRRLTMTPSELLYDSANPNNVTFIKYNGNDETKNNKNDSNESDTTNNNRKDLLNDTFSVSNSSKQSGDLNSTYTTETTTAASQSNGDVDQLADRMTQSLHVDTKNALHPGRKTSLNGTDLPRVPSAPSLKDLANPPCASSLPSTATHHYLLSPHLMRRKIRPAPPPSTAPAYHEIHYNQPTVAAVNGNSVVSSNKSRLLRSASSAAAANGNNNCVPSSYGLYQASPQHSPSLSSRHAFIHDQYSAEQYNGGGGGAMTPSGSPLVNRRMNRDNTNSVTSSITHDSDVFSRLTSTMSNQVEQHSVGQILPNSSAKPVDKQFPLACTHVVVGHRRPVLSITATNEVLFSGSKDGTAKIWDLAQCVEVFSLNDHPDSVNVVRYDEYNKLIFTCSKSIIKIWDPRDNPVNCVRTLCSSGVAMDNPTNESLIYDIRLSADGSTFFSTADRLVRVWDMRKFQSVGKLSTGHNSLVTCLAVNEEEDENRLVVTGSKDHTVKVFELDSGIVGIHIPKYTLKPPHYDGIEALKLTEKGRFLFSGGRDGRIKKWDLVELRLIASLSNCHRDWVLALDTFQQGNILLSACRGGYLRAWDSENCRSYGEIQAHSMAINDIATIPQVVFTASSDCTINLWQLNESSPLAENGN